MAGIGFQIEKILEGDTYLASIKAHIFSALICSGPWILSIITIFCLGYFAPSNIDSFQIAYFRTTIIYIFAFSLIMAGILYLSLSRYLSDKLYQKDEEALVPAFNSAALFLLLIQTAVGFVIFFTAVSDKLLALLSLLTYLAISMIWLIMIFLTALRDYMAVTMAYLAGTVAAIFSALFLGRTFGLSGYFAGYLLGNLLIMAILSARIFIEFGTKRAFDWDVFLFLAKNKKLVFTGVFYNVAIWIDKIIFWTSDRAYSITHFLRSFPEYESAVFFAYLTIIPALSIFLIHVETNFYKSYRMFYTRILDRGTYGSIRHAKGDMASSLRKSVLLLLAYQGLITLMAITFAPELANIFSLKAVSIPIFRIATLGAFLHSLLLVTIIVILYFDFQGLALGIAALFMVTNALFTFVTENMEIYYLGYGYFFSALVSLAAAFYFLNFRFKRLEYLTFAMQPLGVHREEEVA